MGVGVGAVILREDGKIFLAQRGERAKNERGKWEFPGGSVEFGDTLQDTIRREMREEHGVEIELIRLLDVCNHIIQDEGQHWVSPCFLSRIKAGEPVIREPEKCAAIGWFSISEMNTLPLSLVTVYIQELLKNQYPDGLIFDHITKQ